MGDAITGEAKDVGEVIGGWAFSVAYLILWILKNRCLYYREANAL